MMNKLKNTFDNLVNSMCTYITDNGIKSIVLGLSGGLDTTLAAYICHYIVKKLDTVKFIAVSLPSGTNNIKQTKFADKIGNILADEYIVHNIETDYISLSESFMGTGQCMTEIQKSNLKSRLRMMFLYDVALSNKGIVIDCIDKTEKYLGFWTLHGNIGDIAPLADLWKTDIYNLMSFISEQETNIVLKNKLISLLKHKNNIIADNDCNDKVSPLTYMDIDIILKRVINARYIIMEYNDISQYIKSSYMKDLLEKYGETNISMIIRRYFNSHYKRKSLPIIIKNTL